MTGATPDLLAAIVAATRERVRVQQRRVPAAALEAVTGPARRPGAFAAALARTGRVNVIAECKRRSPSRGVLRREYDPVALACEYERAGAAALSVLTEPTFFDGQLEHLRAVRKHVGLPLLRKDFIVDAYQLLEAREAGADAVLLIVAALESSVLADLHVRAVSLGLDVLVEVHDERELATAIGAEARIIGVNNRNLRTLAVDVEASRRLVAGIPADKLAVAESGLRDAAELDDLRGRGFHAFLVGERLMTTEHPGAALSALVSGTANRDREGTSPLGAHEETRTRA